tara:strand:+ start:9992 stop:12595 length:2604 start_codon:yes stop_codon:yes gene_type:complete
MTEGMMGRTSDTRIYNPRSESSEMFRANHEDERPPSGIEDAKSKERRKDKKQAKREREEKEDKKIRHIKVRRHHLGLGNSKPSEDMDEEEEQYKPRGSTDNPANQTMPSGAGGFLSSLAMGAKGPGAAGGQMIQMSEPMDMAWRLLKYDEYYDDDDDDDDLYDEYFYYDDEGNPRDPRKNPEHEYHEENMYNEAGEELKNEIEQLRESPGFFNKPEPAVTDKEREEEELKQSIADFLSSQKLTGEPMDMAYQLLKQQGHHIDFNNLTNTPRETWLKQIIGFDTPTISNMVDMGMMENLGFDNHMHGDPEMLSEMTKLNMHPQEAMDALMEHRNSLIYLSETLEGRGGQLPSWLVDSHNNAGITQELGNTHPMNHIAANLAALYTNANYLGHLLGPQMGEPDDDWQNKLAGEPMDMAWQLLKMSEAEALHYHHPDIEAQRHIDKKRNVSGHLTGHMKQGLSRKIRQDAIDRGQRNVLAGIPEYLRFAHGTHPEMMRRRAMIPDDKTPLLPTTADERNKIADLEEVARKIKLNPQTVYHQQMYSTQMLPPGPFTEPEPEPEPDIQDSPIPGMAFVNGQLVPDPRVKKSSPMDFAWDMIQKKESKRSVARRRKKEGYAKWRPSTGQFEKPKGGGDQRNTTSRRSKNISRNLPMGRKTGLMRPHLSVEMSHRGLASKQPPSKDPQKYRPYLASQDARKLLGGVRTVYTPHMRHSQRSFIAGPTGGGRLTNTLQYPRIPRPRLRAVRTPSIVPPKMKVPRLARPKMPSMITMSEDTPQRSDILKANAYQAALMRIALKEIRELMREKKDKDSKKKGKGEPDTAGAASTLPNYPANNPKQTNRNQGATEDVNNEPRDFGLDPGALVGRGSGRV